MILSPTDTASVLPFSLYTAQASAYPLVRAAKDPFPAVFKIPKPANQDLIDLLDILDNSSPAVPVTAPGLLAQRLFQLRQIAFELLDTLMVRSRTASMAE